MTHGGDDNFDHLVKVLSARFLHYKPTVFSFFLNIFGKTFRLCEHPVYQHFYPLILASINDSCLYPLFL